MIQFREIYLPISVYLDVSDSHRRQKIHNCTFDSLVMILKNIDSLLFPRENSKERPRETHLVPPSLDHG